MKDNWKKTFAVIYAGQAFSIVGSAAVQFSMIWWLTVQTESAIALTTASIVGFLPNLLVGPFAGVWVDRYNRRTVMMLADGFIALSSVVMGVVFLLNDAPPVWFLYIILFLRGLGGAFHMPAMQAAIPLLVPADMLTKAGGWGNMVQSLSNMLGPVLGAALMAVLPLSAIMLVDILGAAFAIVCLCFVTIPDVPRSDEHSDFFGDLKLGVAAIRGNRPFMAIILPMMLVNVLYMPLGSLFPLLIRTHFGGTAWHNGIAEFAFAGGMLGASLIMGIWGGSKRRFLMVSAAVVALGILSAVGGILPPGAFAVFAVGCVFMGATGVFLNVPLMAYTQETIAPDMLGKVMSFIMMAMSLAMPVGLLLAGPVSERTGVDNWFFYSGLALVAVGIYTWAVSRKYDVPSAQQMEDAQE